MMPPYLQDSHENKFLTHKGLAFFGVFFMYTTKKNYLWNN